MEFSKIQSNLKIISDTPLGGIDAQFKLAPSHREKYQLDKILAKNPKESAILILICPNVHNEACVILTKRADYEGHHANQISFPGGKRIQKDTSFLDTALRETQEELGVNIHAKQIIKKMTQVFIPPSNFIVQPFLSISPVLPIFSTNYEVVEVLTPTLTQLMSPEAIIYKKMQHSNGKFFTSPGFMIEKNFIWGATAMMLSEVIELLHFIDK